MLSAFSVSGKPRHRVGVALIDGFVQLHNPYLIFSNKA
jgi:hypothetical protein